LIDAIDHARKKRKLRQVGIGNILTKLEFNHQPKKKHKETLKGSNRALKKTEGSARRRRGDVTSLRKTRRQRITSRFADKRGYTVPIHEEQRIVRA